MIDERLPASAAAWDRLSELFTVAVTLSPAERATYVQEACDGEPQLQSELSALLESAERAPAFLSTLAHDVLAPVLDAAVASSETLPAPALLHDRPPTRSGTRVRHYEVREPLGSGGMGIVYRGRDTRLGRDVALKFLSAATFADPTARQRLIREARAVSSLDNPHVCAMHAIEETDDDSICLVMNYCAGGTLRDVLRAGPVSMTRAMTISTQLAKGLASAHQRQIIHRDLKPANIGFGENDTVKILDFGVAVRVMDDETVSLTGGRGFAGTVPYCAPELLRGAPPTVQTDLWALGVVLYEMLSGRRPFAGAVEDALVFAIINDEPAPIVCADGAALPEPLTTLLAQLLAKDPATRPDRADTVIAQLEAMTQGPEHRASTPPLPLSVASQRRVLSPTRLTIMAVCVVAITGAALLFRQSRPIDVAPAATPPASTPLPTLAVLPFAIRGGGDLEYLHDGMVDLLTPAFDATGLVRGIDPNAVVSATTEAVDAAIDSVTAQALAKKVGASRYVVGSIVRTGARVTLRATLYSQPGREMARAHVDVDDLSALFAGVESLVRQLVAAELRAPGDSIAALAAATTTSSRALRAYLQGERELRDARPAAAVTSFSTAVAADSTFALAWYRLARAARWSEVDSLNALAVQRANALAGTLPLRAQQLVQGYHALRFGNPLVAERYFRQIVRDYPTDVEAWMLLGETLFENNPYVGRSSSEAIPVFQRVMQLDPRNREVTVYLMELASRTRNTGWLDTLFLMYFSPNSAGEQPGIRDTYLALHARRVRSVRQDITDPISAHTALRRIGLDSVDLLAAPQLARILTAPSASRALQLDGWLALASLAAAAGQWSDATRHWQQAARLDAAATLFHHAMCAVAPGAALSTDSLRALLRSLTVNQDTLYGSELSRGEQRSLQSYLTGLVAARLGDLALLSQTQRALAQRMPNDRISLPLSEALAGHLARRRGDLPSALAAFERSDIALPLRVRTRVPALAQYADRWARVDVLRALNRSEEADRWLAALRDGASVWGAAYLIQGNPATKRSAGI
ncbi:protein kinase [Gemmatimonas sp.]|uniref:protein kinase domain-containing protein n=1 Tax=Gemmatimonas sp. TaxID=1962908 RepID=UPI003342B202